MGVKKAEAARILNVSRSRISQYVKQGMPLAADGSVEISEARAWLDANIDPAKRAGWDKSKVPAPGGSSLADNPWALLGDLGQPTQQGFALAAANAVYRVAFHAVWAAADAGIRRDRAREMALTLQVVLWADLDHFGQSALGIKAAACGDGWLSLQSGVIEEQLARVPWAELFEPDGESKVIGHSRLPG